MSIEDISVRGRNIIPSARKGIHSFINTEREEFLKYIHQMYTKQDLGIRRRNIIPSARKGIHSCINTEREDMVRYGEDMSSDDEDLGRGSDEVDNVMSKFSNSSSPVLMRKARGNSLTPTPLQHTDDSNDNALAKSLPATLPSHSHYSDDLDDWLTHGLSAGQYNQPGQSTSPRSRSNRTIQDLNTNLNQTPYSPLEVNPYNRKENIENKEGTVFMSIVVLLSACGLAYCYYACNPTLASSYVHYDELRFYSDLTELGAKYKVGDDSVLQLKTGISTIYKREDTCCFIFVYNGMGKEFDLIEFDDFVNNVAANAAKFLRNESNPVEHKVVEGSDLKMGSHSQLVKAYREDIAKTGVLLIKDIEHVPSPLAMAFHYYCDEYNPLVKKSAIFFTLNTARCHNSGEKSSHASVERCLKKKWNTVPKDNIGPLLTRVVSVVVDVTKGF